MIVAIIAGPEGTHESHTETTIIPWSMLNTRLMPVLQQRNWNFASAKAAIFAMMQMRCVVFTKVVTYNQGQRWMDTQTCYWFPHLIDDPALQKKITCRHSRIYKFIIYNAISLILSNPIQLLLQLVSLYPLFFIFFIKHLDMTLSFHMEVPLKFYD